MTAAPVTIRRRFQIAATTFALALFLPAASGWWSTHALAARADNAVRKAISAQHLSARFVAAAMQAAHAGQSYVLAPSPKLEIEFKRWGQQAHDFAHALSQDAAESGDAATAIARLDRQLAQLENHLVRAHRHVDLEELNAARAELELSVPYQAEMLRAVSMLAVAEAAHLDEVTQAMRHSARYQGIVFITVFAIAALVGAIITRWLSQTVARPLTRLVGHASAIAMGESNAHTPVASVPGEFGALAVAMNGASESLYRVAVAEALAQKSQRLALVGQLASGVAHELNNPLHTILLTVGLLQEEATDSVLRRELDVVRAQAARARGIVRDLMATARPSVGLREFVPADSIVRRAQGELTRLATVHHARLVLDLRPHSLPHVEADRDDLTRVLGILVSNAAHAAGAKGTVTIRADTIVDDCRLTVEDDGPGLTDDVLARLFEPFFTTKAVGEGSGMGLSVALGIVQSHGGGITAENRRNQLGARFIVRIPIASARAVARATERGLTPISSLAIEVPVTESGVDIFTAAEPAHAPEIRPAPRALIVDDEPTVRSVLCRILQRAGWRIEEARDGAVALELIDRAEQTGDRYSLILCDLRMPNMSGIALHDMLALQHPDALQLMTITSGDLASPDVVEFLRRTSCPVLAKPLDMKEVLRLAAVASSRQPVIYAQ